MKSVRVYSTTTCPYCYAAKDLLDRKGIAYEEIDVTGNPAARRWLLELTGRRTVPQIFIGDESIGGCDDLHDLARTGELNRLLSREDAA